MRLSVWHFSITEAYSLILIYVLIASRHFCGLLLNDASWLECAPWNLDPIKLNQLLELKITTLIVFYSVCSTKGSN